MATKKEKINKEQLSPEKIQALRDAYRKQVDSYKNRVRPLVNFLRKNKLKMSNAHVGNERIEYFRLDEFEKLLEEKAQDINKDQSLKQLTKNAYAEFVFFKRPQGIKSKYPKVLEPVPPESTEKKYASFRFDTTEHKRGMTILIIALVLLLVLFPIWPFTVKYALWLVSLVLLVTLTGIIVLRLIIFLICIIFNYHIWIFPNLFFATGILDSFIPIIEIAKGDRSWFNLFVRLFGISVFLLLSLHVYLNPTFLDETFESTKITISDVHDWGIEKIKNEGNFSQRALTNLDTILNETAHIDEPGDGEEEAPEVVTNKDQKAQQNQEVAEQIKKRFRLKEDTDL